MERSQLGCCAWRGEEVTGRELGFAGKEKGEAGWAQGKETGHGEKERWASGLGCQLGLGWFLFSFSRFSFPFLSHAPLNLFEFKFQFEFKPSTQTKRTMHQHEYNNKFLNLDKF